MLINENELKEFNVLDQQIKDAESFLFSQGIDQNGAKNLIVSDQAKLARNSHPENPLNHSVPDDDSQIENELTRLTKYFLGNKPTKMSQNTQDLENAGQNLITDPIQIHEEKYASDQVRAMVTENDSSLLN